MLMPPVNMRTSLKLLHNKVLVRGLVLRQSELVCGCRTYSSVSNISVRTLTPHHSLYKRGIHTATVSLVETSIDAVGSSARDITTSTVDAVSSTGITDALSSTSITDAVSSTGITDAVSSPGITDAVSSSSITDAASSTGITDAVTSITAADPGYIPPAPAAAEWVDAPASAVLETLAQAGLDTWWPAGLIRSALEFLHLNLDVPWWGSIVAVTLVFRCVIFPVWMKGQQYTIKMHNYQPEQQKIMREINDAKIRGDDMKQLMLQQDLAKFYKRDDVSLIKPFLPIFCQIPFFAGMFSGLRGMAYAPIEPMKTGGLFWFPDLTIADPYFILPVLAGATMYGVIYFGSEGGNTMASLGPIAKKLMLSLPIVVGATTAYFPAALGVYWVTSNTFSMLQVATINVPTVKTALQKYEFFRLPVKIKHPPQPGHDKSFVRSAKDMMEESRIKSGVAALQKQTNDQFLKAGTGTIMKTFKHDPTKPPPEGGVKRRKRKYY